MLKIHKKKIVFLSSLRIMEIFKQKKITLWNYSFLYKFFILYMREQRSQK